MKRTFEKDGAILSFRKRSYDGLGCFEIWDIESGLRITLKNSIYTLFLPLVGFGKEKIVNLNEKDIMIGKIKKYGPFCNVNFTTVELPPECEGYFTVLGGRYIFLPQVSKTNGYCFVNCYDVERERFFPSPNSMEKMYSFWIFQEHYLLANTMSGSSFKLIVLDLMDTEEGWKIFSDKFCSEACESFIQTSPSDFFVNFYDDLGFFDFYKQAKKKNTLKNIFPFRGSGVVSKGRIYFANDYNEDLTLYSLVSHKFSFSQENGRPRIAETEE